MPKDYSEMTIRELEEDVSKLFELDGSRDELFRTVVFMGQLEFAKHIYHDRKFTSDVRPHKNASKTAEISSFGQVLIQLLLLIRTRNLEFDKVFEYAVEHLKDQEWKEKKPGNDGEIRGLPVGGGRVLGKAFVVTNSKPLCDAPDDCIIVMSHASSNISQHLGRVKAIVTDHGGKLSHLAIVAREMGKPAIVGTGNATRLIGDSDRIMVDADNGVVKRV